MKIALLGAESTGKSDLGKLLEQHFMAQRKTVEHIPEYLRSWCDKHKRTPRVDEQLGIVNEQISQINSAAPCDFLISDTTPLLTAVYSDLLFGDSSLYELAMPFQSSFDLTLLMGLDMPWVPDGIQRDGPHRREPVDAKIRAALARGGIPFQVVYGLGVERLQHALQCLKTPMFDSADQIKIKPKPKPQSQSQKLRNWVCERCSDPECEHRLFQDLLKNS